MSRDLWKTEKEIENRLTTSSKGIIWYLIDIRETSG